MYTIWGRPDCVWCNAAKQFLENKGERYDYVELTADKVPIFSNITNGARTVPQVFDPIGGLIGGYEDLVEFYKTRE
jgi:glutaredoxin